MSTAEADRERRALLVAGEAVIGEKGFARSSVEEVCERAKLGPDAFYTHFQGMGALLRALSQDFASQMIHVIDQSTRSGIWKSAAARAIVDVAVRSILDVILERRGLVRAFLAHGAIDASLGADLRRIGTHMSERVLAVLAESKAGPPVPSRAVAFALLAATAVGHHYILVGGDSSGVPFTNEEIIEETSRAVSLYLGLPRTSTAGDDVADGSPTEMIEALRTSEIETVAPGLHGAKPRD